MTPDYRHRTVTYGCGHDYVHDLYQEPHVLKMSESMFALSDCPDCRDVRRDLALGVTANRELPPLTGLEADRASAREARLRLLAEVRCEVRSLRDAYLVGVGRTATWDELRKAEDAKSSLQRRRAAEFWLANSDLSGTELLDREIEERNGEGQ